MGHEPVLHIPLYHSEVHSRLLSFIPFQLQASCELTCTSVVSECAWLEGGWVCEVQPFLFALAILIAVLTGSLLFILSPSFFSVDVVFLRISLLSSLVRDSEGTRRIGSYFQVARVLKYLGAGEMRMTRKAGEGGPTKKEASSLHFDLERQRREEGKGEGAKEGRALASPSNPIET